MKILMVCNQFYPAIGGVETHILNLTKRFVEDGNTVEVVSSASAGGKRNGKINGVFYKKLYGFKLLEVDAATIIPSLPIFLFKNLFRYDVVHVHSYGYFVSWVTILICKVKKKKVIYTSHYADETTLPKIIKTIYDFCFAGWSFRMATIVIALTQTEKKILIQKFHVSPKRIHVIPNGIEISKNQKQLALSEKMKILNRHRINPNFKTIITIGRIAKNKGQIFLIKAVSDIKNISLIIIGRNWGEKNNLMEYIKNNKIKNVFIFENISDLEKYKLLSSSDVFVLPSIASEAFGIVLLEAMGHGLPVIATSVGGISDLIKEGENGYLVRPGNVNDLEKKIEFILKDKKINKMRQFCLSYSRSFSWDNIYLKTKNLYTAT